MKEKEGRKKTALKFYCLCCHVHSQVLVTLGFVDRGSWLIWPPFAFDYCLDFNVFAWIFWVTVREAERGCEGNVNVAL